MIPSVILNFTPLLVLLAVFTVRKKYQFKGALGIIAVATVAHIAIRSFTGPAHSSILGVGAQILVSAVVFVLLLGSFGAKVSGESYALLIGVGYNFPVDLNNPLPFVVMLVVGISITFRVAIVRMRKYQESIGETSTSPKALLSSTALDLGIATQSLPSGEHLPDRDSFGPGVRTSMAPGMLVGAILAVVTAILMTL